MPIQQDIGSGLLWRTDIELAQVEEFGKTTKVTCTKNDIYTYWTDTRHTQ